LLQTHASLEPLTNLKIEAIPAAGLLSLGELLLALLDLLLHRDRPARNVLFSRRARCGSDMRIRLCLCRRRSRRIDHDRGTRRGTRGSMRGAVTTAYSSRRDRKALCVLLPAESDSLAGAGGALWAHPLAFVRALAKVSAARTRTSIL